MLTQIDDLFQLSNEAFQELAQRSQECDEYVTEIEDLSASAVVEPQSSCVDDATTPQECLNEWVDRYAVDSSASCFIDGDTRTYEGYKYVIFWGGCEEFSVDAVFDQGIFFWLDSEVYIANGEKVNLKSRTFRRIVFNFRTGQQDRVGFRLPLSKDIEYSNASVV